MKSKLTILNISLLIYLLSCLGFTIMNYKQLSGHGGWGLLSVFGLLFFGFIGLLIDFVLRKTVKNKVILNLVGSIIVVLYLAWIWPQF